MIVIIYPGHFSVDWVVITQQALRKNASGTSLEAMSSLIEKVSQIIKERNGDTISHSRIEEAIKNKKDKIMVHGAKINFNEIMNIAAKESSKIAIESLKAQMRKESNSPDAIILTGSGA